jgi:plastocyanin
MNTFYSRGVSSIFKWSLALAILIVPQAIHAQAWLANAGAQSTDLSHQALAFLPNELWIHAGDSVTWTLATDEPHTVTFLTPGQITPAFPVGCPGTQASGVSFDGTSCVNSGLLFDGQTYTVSFPTAGNVKLECLLHPNMTGEIHVLALSQTLPFDQTFYNAAGLSEQNALLLAPDTSRTSTQAAAQMDEVGTGTGRIVATGGGTQTLSVMRFAVGIIAVHVGDTVEWTNLDPVTPHTVTFGTEPANPVPPSSDVTVASDGTLQTTLNSTTASTNSGLIAAANQDQTGLPQTPAGVTRFRVKFTSPGTFNYICSLHNTLGMVGTVIVHP